MKIEGSMHPYMKKFFFQQGDRNMNPLNTYLSSPEDLLQQEDSMRHYMLVKGNQGYYKFYNPISDRYYADENGNNTSDHQAVDNGATKGGVEFNASMSHISEYGTEYLSDYK